MLSSTRVASPAPALLHPTALPGDLSGLSSPLGLFRFTLGKSQQVLVLQENRAFCKPLPSRETCLR